MRPRKGDARKGDVRMRPTNLELAALVCADSGVVKTLLLYALTRHRALLRPPLAGPPPPAGCPPTPTCATHTDCVRHGCPALFTLQSLFVGGTGSARAHNRQTVPAPRAVRVWMHTGSRVWVRVLWLV